MNDAHAERTDDELMLLARGGAQDAFDVLVRRYQAQALAVAERFVGKWDLASDVVQDTFLNVHGALSSYRPNGKFRQYLYHVLINQCRMAYRRRCAEDRCQRAVLSVHDGLWKSGDAEYLAREQQRQVRAALDRLSERLRLVVILRANEEFSYRQIAETLSIPVGTVKRRLFDALDQLRHIVNEQCIAM